MTATRNLIHAIADALIEADRQDATEWLDCGGRAAVERGVAGWRTAIEEGAWVHQPEDILVLRALRHIEHAVELTGGSRIETRIRALVDEDWHGRRPTAKARIGEVFAHELLRSDTATNSRSGASCQLLPPGASGLGLFRADCLPRLRSPATHRRDLPGLRVRASPAAR